MLLLLYYNQDEQAGAELDQAQLKCKLDKTTDNTNEYELTPATLNNMLWVSQKHPTKYFLLY